MLLSEAAVLLLHVFLRDQRTRIHIDSQAFCGDRLLEVASLFSAEYNAWVVFATVLGAYFRRSVMKSGIAPVLSDPRLTVCT